MLDASPDGWGKAILSMTYPDIFMAAPEYIAAAGADRVGHLQFGPDAGGPALWAPSPALLDLPNEQDDLAALADAADAVEAGIATASHLTRLLDSAADIGGAQPKVRIQVGGEAWIAKMRTRDDAFDHQRVEAACPIPVPPPSWAIPPAPIGLTVPHTPTLPSWRGGPASMIAPVILMSACC